MSVLPAELTGSKQKHLDSAGSCATVSSQRGQHRAVISTVSGSHAHGLATRPHPVAKARWVVGRTLVRSAGMEEFLGGEGWREEEGEMREGVCLAALFRAMESHS